MIFYILNREMDVVASMSNDSQEMLWIDDTSGGQTISLVNGCAIGSFDFKTDPYLPDSVYVKAGNFIAFNDKYNRTRLYTIMTVEGDDELDVHCEDIGLDLINEMANAWNFETDQTLDFYLNQVFGNSSWKVVYEASGLSTQTRHLKFDNNTDTKLSRLESIMSGFGFEGDFQITMEYMSVKSMEFHVYKTLGNKTEYDISKIYIDSINLISLNRSESINDLYTAVLPSGGTVEGKPLDISSIEYDDGQFWTTKGDNKLYDRLAAQKWSRFAGTSAQDKTKDPAYIYGHYSSNTTAVGTLFDEALANLKEHHDVKLAYEAKLLDLDSDLGDWIKIVDHAKQQDVYLKARIQEVTNHYTVSGEDEGKLANYKLLSTANGDAIRNLLNQIQEKVSKVTVSDLYFTIDDQGSYAPINAEWSANQPDIPEGKFLWIKTVDKYSDGTERVTYTVTKNKTDYHGPATVVSRVPVYFLSTSQYSALKEDGSVPEKSDWTTEQPAYKDDRYFWKREIVTWSDGSVDYTFATYDQQMTEAYKKLADANKDILNLQDQVDGLIESWSADPVPTLKNYPANEWKTDEAKKNHIGDLYYDKSNKCYRFMQNSDGSFAWKLIADTDVTKAIADAQKALDATDQSVTGVTTEYYASTSATELKGGSWSEDRPAWTESNYIWSRTKTTTKAGITTYSSPSCIQGNSGTDGKDGISPTVAISKTDGSTTITITDKNGTHSQTVKDGVNGTPGATGADGKTSYFHVKYSNDGGKTFTPNNGEEVGVYIGTYSDFKIEDSTSVSAYTWAKIKGEPGAKGADGTSVKITAKSVTYQASTSGTETPTGAWVANPPTVAKGQYLWTKTVVTYSDGNSTTAYSVAYQGTNGTNGKNGTNGIGVKSTEVTYQIWANGTSTPSGTWVATVPDTTADKPYLWTRTIITYTDNTKSTSYSVGSTLKGVNVGGRNLLRGSSKWAEKSPWQCQVATKDVAAAAHQMKMEASIENGKTYILQATTDGVWGNHITDGSGNGVTHIYCYFRTQENVDSNNLDVYTKAQAAIKYTDGWISPVDISTNHGIWKIEIPEKDSNYGNTKFVSMTLRIDVHGDGKTVYPVKYWNFKLELGNIATDWTPAPEDVDADISNAQTSADKANTNASNAQSSANNALDTANKADAKADQAKSYAASANTAAQIAKKQADNAQAKSDEANRIANGAQIGVSNIEQVVKIDTQGVRIYEKANSKNYVHQKSDGSHFYTNNIENGVLGPDSRMNNLAVQDYLMFGAHRAELKIEDGEEGTALFHVGDIK